MTKLFCNYEIALKLKELGFDEKCFGRIYADGGYEQLSYLYKNSDAIGNITSCSAPLTQQAISFLFNKLDFYYPYIRIEIFADGSGQWIQPQDDGIDALELEFDNLEEAILKATNFLYGFKIRKELTYEERISWFVNNYYETGMEYLIMLENMKNDDLDNFKWYYDIIRIPKYNDEL